MFEALKEKLKYPHLKENLPGSKVPITMHEFGLGTLHSGSDKGPKVTNPKQAIAIAMSQERKRQAGMR